VTPDQTQARLRAGRPDGRLAERSFDSLTNPANIRVPAPGEPPVTAEPRRPSAPRGGRAVQVERRRPLTSAAREAERTRAARAAQAEAVDSASPPTPPARGPEPAAGTNTAPHHTGSLPTHTGSLPPQAAGSRPAADKRPEGSPNEDHDVSSVRPFVVTRGRTQATTDTRLESILEVANQQWLADKGKGLSPEELAIVRQIATTYLTVAEVSAHLKLPVGVVKVLVSDLAESGVLLVHDTVAGAGGLTAGAVSREQTLELLESVLNAISEL
jgi:hypothetical protein